MHRGKYNLVSCCTYCTNWYHAVHIAPIGIMLYILHQLVSCCTYCTNWYHAVHIAPTGIMLYILHQLVSCCTYCTNWYHAVNIAPIGIMLYILHQFPFHSILSHILLHLVPNLHCYRNSSSLHKVIYHVRGARSGAVG